MLGFWILNSSRMKDLHDICAVSKTESCARGFSNICGANPGKRISIRGGGEERQVASYDSRGRSFSVETFTEIGPNGVSVGPKEAWLSRHHSGFTPDPRIRRSFSSRTKQFLSIMTHSDAAQICWPSPMQPPPVRG